MKTVRRFPILALVWLVAVSGLSAKEVVSEITPPEPATVSADRVNVRARASLVGERVTQLRKGDQVTVLAKVTVAPPREGEPADWLKIAMPAAGQTWVHIGFVKEAKVTVSKLNVRAGGGERFSIVGLLAKGDAVKEKRVAGDWIEIEHPAGAYAYIAAQFVALGQATEETPEETPEDKPAEVAKTDEPEGTPEAKPAETTPEAEKETADVTEISEPEENKAEPEEPAETGGMPDPPEPEVVVLDASSGIETQQPPMGNPEDAEEAKPEPAPAITEAKLPVPPSRIVTREGRIKRRFFRSPKAPSRFELLDDNGRTINYLYSSDSGPLKTAEVDDGEPITFERLMSMLRNRRVVLTGIEAVDSRWPALPLLDVRTLKTIP
ncbi:MAG: SH3 domain-containing protein [Verrucomicrobiota bacterium]|nr:SH3 domain-containing protein [Verrucomicrobiota bacterium]